MAGTRAGEKKARDLRAGVALLWGEQDQPTRGPKPSLTPHRIAEAAVELADAEGLEAVSMNKVAAAFGVSAMALYRYVPGKTELVELMVEAAVKDAPGLGAEGSEWRPRLTAWARSCWEVYRGHPWLLAATAMRRQVMGPHQLAWLDAALGILEPTGLTAPQRHQIFLLVMGHVRSLAQQLADFDEEHERQWLALTGELLVRQADRFPALTRAVDAGVFAPDGEGAADDDDPFEFGLARILDGVQALIDRPGS
ncbi:TetR/AcrR family transcriptional regulator [Streptomyces sp. NPDC057499]|uniref:TetR/AcrR family transcriptional regulator n=1 Tax=Streptomyces sp. NPDC057499 TaxID=3346150 RepID=UPI0036878561